MWQAHTFTNILTLHTLSLPKSTHNNLDSYLCPIIGSHRASEKWERTFSTSPITMLWKVELYFMGFCAYVLKKILTDEIQTFQICHIRKNRFDSVLLVHQEVQRIKMAPCMTPGDMLYKSWAVNSTVIPKDKEWQGNKPWDELHIFVDSCSLDWIIII